MDAASAKWSKKYPHSMNRWYDSWDVVCQAFHPVPAVAKIFHLFQNIIYAFIAHQLDKIPKAGFIIECLTIDFQIRDAEIVKRAQQILFQCLLQSNFIRNIVVIQIKDIEIVRSLRTRSHTQQELRFKVLQNPLVAFRAGAMRLVDTDKIKFVRSELFQHLLFGHHLHGGKEIIRIVILFISGQ